MLGQWLCLKNMKIVETALKLYGRRRFDVADTLLYAYNKVRRYEICTFDKKLNKLLK